MNNVAIFPTSSSCIKGQKDLVTNTYANGCHVTVFRDTPALSMPDRLERAQLCAETIKNCGELGDVDEGLVEVSWVDGLESWSSVQTIRRNDENREYYADYLRKL